MTINLQQWGDTFTHLVDEDKITGEIASKFNILQLNKMIMLYKANQNILGENLRLKSKVFIFGAGGTTSWFLPKLLKIYNDAFHKSPSDRYPLEIVLMDQDIVEPKNLIRQNFITDDIGFNKAQVLSERYSELYQNIKVSFVDKFATYRRYDSQFLADKKFEPEHFMDVADLGITKNDILINLVDNEGFKKKLDAFIINSRFHGIKYLCAGVNLYNGQVYYTNNIKSNCYTLDHLDLFNDFEDVSVHACADADATGTPDNPDQLFNGNDIAASLLANMFQTALIDIPLYKKVNFISGNNISVNKDRANYSHLYTLLNSFVNSTSEYTIALKKAQNFVSEYGLDKKTTTGIKHYKVLAEHEMISNFIKVYRDAYNNAVVTNTNPTVAAPTAELLTA